MEIEKTMQTDISKVVLGGAAAGLLIYLLAKLNKKDGRNKSILHHTIPPIIIKSVDDPGEPINFESRYPLVDSSFLKKQSGKVHLLAKRYKMPSFGKTKSVGIRREMTANGTWITQGFRNSSGLIVHVFLQFKDGNRWKDEPNGPHIVITGTDRGFPLTSDQLSSDTSNPNSSRPQKRSYKINKKWRIGSVKVGNHPAIETGDYDSVEVEFFED